MSGSRYEGDVAPAWEAELDKLCSGQSGWKLLQCLSSLVLLRVMDVLSIGDEGRLSAVARALEEASSCDELANEVVRVANVNCLCEEDRAFVEARVGALAAEVELWAADCGLFDAEALEEEPANADEASADNSSLRVLGKALPALIRFVELLPLEEEAGCFDAVVRRCLAASGRTGGLFSTPECVTSLVARMLAPDMREARSLYDPCCGAGFLLSACAAERADAREDADAGLAAFGQDIDPEAGALLRVRVMIAALLAQRASAPMTALDMKVDDVLAGEWHCEEAPFDVVVSHAPTLMEWDGSSNAALAADERFACAGALAPKTAADLAFVLHAYHCLAEGGVAALIVYPAPLRRGDAERTIRRYLLEQDAIDAVIQLPPRLLLDSSMAISILVLRRDRKHEDVLFIDAMQEGAKAGEGNVLSSESIECIARAYELRSDEPAFARNVPKGEIVRNAWSLTVADYFKAEAGKIVADANHMKQVRAGLSDIAAIKREKFSGILPW